MNKSDESDLFSKSTSGYLSDKIKLALKRGFKASEDFKIIKHKGKITRVTDSSVEAYLPDASKGQMCSIMTGSGKKESDKQENKKSKISKGSEKKEPTEIMGEVTAVDHNKVVLLPYATSTTGISTGNWISPLDFKINIQVGEFLKGGVVNGLGEIIASSPNHSKYIDEAQKVSLLRSPPDALTRPPISEVLPVGVAAIDGMLTAGKGQRMGIFAPAGVGKSTLLGMMAQHTEADVVVLGLIGERGREVNEFLEEILPPETRKKCVVVVTTSDKPAIEKVKAIYTATTIAEHFRDKGKDVLLLVDSLTRFARAQRDVAIASGEHIPASGYPASVFSSLAPVLERAGLGATGSITAFYTVLVENEKANDILAEEVRSILDGHIILSRKLAEGFHYPAIDVLASVSRVMPQIVDPNHLQSAGTFRSLYAKYQDVELLVRIGEYVRGEDKEADKAVKLYPNFIQFLKQQTSDELHFDEIIGNLSRVIQ